MRYAAGTQNMKSCIIYSSVTGNTRKVAEALAAASGAPCFPVREAPDPDDYDLLALGFWVRLGQADARTQGYMRRVLGKKVFFFGTLGAWPDSPHARRCAEGARALLEEGGNTVLEAARHPDAADLAEAGRRWQRCLAD